MNESSHARSHAQALHIATLLLRPLIRLLAHCGVGLAEFVELGKRLYVEQAAESLRRDGRRVSDAALSVMTGVHRKDVRRIGAAAPLAPPEQRRPSLLSAVMSLWSGDPRFVDGRGAARPLRRRQQVRGVPPLSEASFEDLLEEVSKGVPPRALLDAWLRQGAVRLDAEGRVCWAAPELAAGEELQQLARTARAAADRLQASWENLHGPRRDHVLFSVRGEGLLEQDVLLLHALVRRWGRRFGDRLNQHVTEAIARGKAEDGDRRYSFGLHSYAEPAGPTAS